MIEPRTIVIGGPTASGKSEFAQLLCELVDGEVVNADSMQVYAGMDIATGKVKQQDRRVPHWLLDILQPGSEYSAALYQQDSRKAIEDIHSRGKAAVVCGGTGFYIRACIDSYEFAPHPASESLGLREELIDYAKVEGAEALWERLHDVDPESAALIHPNNVVRVARALEMNAAGESYSARKEHLKTIPQMIPAKMICLCCGRDALYERIEQRVDHMFEEGLLDEVRDLQALGYSEAIKSAAAIGYAQACKVLDGTMSLSDAKDDMKQASRRYAKRQISWFGSDKRYEWLDIETRSDLTKEAERLACKLSSRN